MGGIEGGLAPQSCIARPLMMQADVKRGPLAPQADAKANPLSQANEGPKIAVIGPAPSTVVADNALAGPGSGTDGPSGPLFNGLTYSVNPAGGASGTNANRRPG